LRHVFLFDVDGVLVDARGYLRALQDTVAQFSRAMRLGEMPPTEAEVRAFESQGLSNEWDSGAACVGALLVDRVRVESELALPVEWRSLLTTLSQRVALQVQPRYVSLAAEAGVLIAQGMLASDAALRALETRADGLALAGGRRAAVTALLTQLLGNPHDIRSPFTWPMQQRVVGSVQVQATYGIPPDLASDCYLTLYDIPNLSRGMRDRLVRARAAGRICGAVYTARPCLPPRDAGADILGYSPEAEAAMSLVGLEDWPLIGMGRMTWLARREGLRPASLVKPSPVQALAAVGAALGGKESESLAAALALHRENTLLGPLSGTGALEIHVFEDAPTGIVAARNAVGELRGAGVAVELQVYGITPENGPKADTMVSLGVTVYSSVDRAADAAIAATESGRTIA
jgi:hypothetical protein